MNAANRLAFSRQNQSAATIAGSAFRSAPPKTSPTPRKVGSPWILNRWRDLLLFIGTPLLLLPIFTLAQLRWSADDIYLYVAAFGAMGHHLPGMMRAYGDKSLFARFKARFIVAPVFLLAVCAICSVWEIQGLLLLVFGWGVWHGLMQTYGFCRIYDAKRGAFDALNRRLDFALCLTWFAAAVILSSMRFRTVLDLYYACAGPIIPVAAITALRVGTAWIVGVVTALFILQIVRGWIHGRRPNLIKLVLLSGSIGFWWYCNVGVGHILVGIALFEVFHDVQYLSIVWLYNRNRVEKDPTARGFMRFVFRRSGSLIGVYIGLVLAYGAIALAVGGLPLDNMKRVLLGVVTASALLHFYYDGFIWKVREPSTRESLGLEGSSSQEAEKRARAWRLSPWLVHGLKWSAFVLPLVALWWLQTMQSMQGSTQNLVRRQAVAAAVPDDPTGHVNLGNAALQEGRVDEAISEYTRALQLRSGDPDTEYFLGIAFSDRGDFDAAVAHYTESLRRRPDFPSAECNLANVFFRQKKLDQARVHYAKSLALKPDQPLAHKNLGDLLRVEGRLEEAIQHYSEALRLHPTYNGAQVALDALRAQQSAAP